MRGRAIFFTTTILATASVAMFAMNGHADRRDAGTRGVIGPDVIAWCNRRSKTVLTLIITEHRMV